MTEITQALLEYGSMGIFAGFLVWQHLSMQKRLDALVQRFQTQLEQLQNKKEEREASLRERYDTVISTLQEEKSSFRVDMENQIKLALMRLEELDKKTEEIKVLSDSLTLIHRESNIQTVKALGILEKMEEEARLKEMARKMQNKDEPNWERR
tara:strand:+ start:3740 stop:4198 length:459 start_codon:yes stop_codon:yes gene_type:complete